MSNLIELALNNVFQVLFINMDDRPGVFLIKQRDLDLDLPTMSQAQTGSEMRTTSEHVARSIHWPTLSINQTLLLFFQTPLNPFCNSSTK